MKNLKVSLCVAAAVIAAALSAFVAVGPSSANAPEQSDAHGIRSQIQNLIDVLDSQGYAELISWDEHVVLVYRLAADREPSPAEFFQLKKLHDRTGLARSDVLSIALRGQGMRLSWEQCRTFLKRVTGADFRVDRSIRDKARQLAAIPEREVIKQVLPPVESSPAGDTGFQLQETDSIVPFEQYNIYFGYLHAHSTISPDGEGSPRRAYEHARDPGGLDFFALTDHGYAFNLWPWEDEWEEMVEAADDSYQPGVYVTLWGFEWTNLVYGHINVINSSEFTDFASESTLHDIYNWITDRPTCFGRFNHPGDYDYTGDEFSHFKPYSYAVEQMVGIENWNGNDGFDRHYYGGSWSSSETSYWDVGNQKGWYLGSLGGQDNHQEDWGIRNDFRTAVLAKELTREDIIDAYMHRRFYSTEDKDLHIDFRTAGYPMGSRLAGVSHIFEIKAWDESGDTFREVRLYRNGEMIRTQNVSGEAIHIVLDESSNNANSAYYYVIIQQNDDNDGNGRNDEAISSPIWISANPVLIDVPSGYWAEDHIYAIFNAGITKGCSKNPLKYCPKKDVTRDQMAAFIVRADDGEPPADYCDTGSPFSDVDPASLFCKYIKRLSELGITKGCGGDKYSRKPLSNATRWPSF